MVYVYTIISHYNLCLLFLYFSLNTIVCVWLGMYMCGKIVNMRVCVCVWTQCPMSLFLWFFLFAVRRRAWNARCAAPPSRPTAQATTAATAPDRRWQIEWRRPGSARRWRRRCQRRRQQRQQSTWLDLMCACRCSWRSLKRRTSTLHMECAFFRNNWQSSHVHTHTHRHIPQNTLKHFITDTQYVSLLSPILARKETSVLNQMSTWLHVSYIDDMMKSVCM